jgi:hypothetical protein
MLVFWWQGGLHVEPQSEGERAALVTLAQALDGSRIHFGPLEADGTGGDVNDQYPVIGIQESRDPIRNVNGGRIGVQEPLRPEHTHGTSAAQRGP